MKNRQNIILTLLATFLTTLPLHAQPLYSITGLGDLPGSSFNSNATDINDQGQVVGHSHTSVTHTISSDRAFIWDSTHGMVDLNNLIIDDSNQGWELITARDINNHNQIVGWGTNPNGDREGFILTPIPEPATMSLLGFGAISLIKRRRTAKQ